MFRKNELNKLKAEHNNESMKNLKIKSKVNGCHI